MGIKSILKSSGHLKKTRMFCAHACYGLMLMIGPMSAHATLIYNITETIGVAQISGTITTDGTLGNVGRANIVDWDIFLDDGTFNSQLNSSTSFIHSDSNHGLIATSTLLSFDHSISVGGGDFFLFFANDLVAFWCLEGPNNGCSGGPGTSNIAINNGSRQRITYMSPVLGVNEIGNVSVPEPSIILLLGSGLALIGFAGRKD